MRGALVLVVAVAAFGVCAGSSASPSATTSLRVTYWPDGGQGTVEPSVWKLGCNPARGTLRNASVTCRRLGAGGVSFFTPVRPDAACTEIYGGPQTARVVGKVAGKRIWATFSRTNGCHISRWDRVSPWLLPRVHTG